MRINNENVMLSEISQTQRDTSCISEGERERAGRREREFKTGIFIETEDRTEVSRAEGRGSGE